MKATTVNDNKIEIFKITEKSALPPKGTFMECFNKSTPYVYGFSFAITPKKPGKFVTGYKDPDKKKTGKMTKFIIAAKLSSVLEKDATSIPIPAQEIESSKILIMSKSKLMFLSISPKKIRTINNRMT